MIAAERRAGPGLSPGSDGRLPFLDVARALAVLTMLAGNLVNVFLTERPRWLAHNLGDELLPFDLPAPVFQFLVGVSLALFLARRHHGTGAPRARWLAARRFALLVALGAVLDGIAAGHLEFRWGVLQTLGAGGLAATALAGTSDVTVLAVAAAILVTHYGPGNNEVHRSAHDCLPFLPLTLLGYLVGRSLGGGDRRVFRRRVVSVAAGCFVLALVLRAAGIPFNKVIGSSSFVTFAGATSAVLIAGLHALEEHGWIFPAPLIALGANALTAWVLQYVLVYYPVYHLLGHVPELPQAAAFAAVAMVMLGLSALTLALARRGVRIPL
jgi:predicted acyltransferase